jgi:hypothetical protein
MGRPGIAVEVSANEREQLVSMSRSRSLQLAQSGRALVRVDHPAGHSPRIV